MSISKVGDIDPIISGNDVTHTVSVSSDTADPNTSHNTDSEDTTISQPPTGEDVDLSVIKTADVDVVTLGDQVTYTILVANNGPGTATNVQIEDNLPQGFSIDSVTHDCESSQCFVDCNPGSLGSGEIVEITIVGTVGFHEAVIDFEGLEEGSVVDSVALGRGIVDKDISGNVSVFGDSARGGINTNAAIIFDATCDAGCSGGEDDLFAPELGKVLITAADLDDEDGDGLISDPDGDSGDLSDGTHTMIVEIDRRGSDPDVVLEIEFGVLNP